ncbi:acyltransferase domain-containing protein [Allonocardiopsis opalescens]|nr:acyltransferase domain-containing protein [Allonocardiopsis opalescens]
MASPHTLSPAAVAEALRLTDAHTALLAELDAVGPRPAPLAPLGERRSRELLRAYGAGEQDAEEVAATEPDPERSPELWWLLDRCVHRTELDVGRFDAPYRAWPQLPETLGAAGRCFYAHVFTHASARVRAWHRERGVTERESLAILADLGRHLGVHRTAFGTVGLNAQSWLSLHLGGMIYEFGRLQFNMMTIAPGSSPGHWYDGERLSGLGPGFQAGDAALGVHIPPTGPLTPEAVEDSFARAREFFATRFPEPTRRLAVCTSWLLDDQLARYLDAGSNIVRFQRRFEAVPGGTEDESDFFWFVFRKHEPHLCQLPQDTALQRAIVAHLREGGRWRVRTGWTRL